MYYLHLLSLPENCWHLIYTIRCYPETIKSWVFLKNIQTRYKSMRTLAKLAPNKAVYQRWFFSHSLSTQFASLLKIFWADAGNFFESSSPPAVQNAFVIIQVLRQVTALHTYSCARGWWLWLFLCCEGENDVLHGKMASLGNQEPSLH